MGSDCGNWTATRHERQGCEVEVTLDLDPASAMYRSSMAARQPASRDREIGLAGVRGERGDCWKVQALSI